MKELYMGKKQLTCRKCGTVFDGETDIGTKVFGTAVLTALTGPFGLLFGPAMSMDERTCPICTKKSV